MAAKPASLEKLIIWYERNSYKNLVYSSFIVKICRTILIFTGRLSKRKHRLKNPRKVVLDFMNGWHVCHCSYQEQIDSGGFCEKCNGIIILND
jgi:hypothetical protein